MRKAATNKSQAYPQGMSLTDGGGRGSLLSQPSRERQRGKYPFAQRWDVKLMFNIDGLLTTVNGSTASRATVRLNSCYRPDYSGGSTVQPYQWDQLTSIYSGYKVNGARVKISFWNGSVDGLVVGYRIRSPFDSLDTTTLGVRLLQEMRNTATDIIAVGATKRVEFQGSVNFAQCLGWTKTQFDSYAPGAVTSNSPMGDILLDVFVIDLGNNTTRTCDYTVSVEYAVELSDYVSPTES
jgi:hypothetical protein